MKILNILAYFGKVSQLNQEGWENIMKKKYNSNILQDSTYTLMISKVLEYFNGRI